MSTEPTDAATGGADPHGYPFPTPGHDELQSRFGIEPRSYSESELATAATRWDEFLLRGQSAQMFIQLVAVCEGSLAEATVLWDALRAHREVGLQRYLERSSRHYGHLYAQSFLSGRSCRRAFEALADVGLIVLWPQAKTVGHKFRVDWVDLSQRLEQIEELRLPGVDEVVCGQVQ